MAGKGRARERLLDAAVRLMAERGSTGWSLRGLAEALGTSHRMLIYHFGSHEGLLLAVVQRVEAEQRERLGEVHDAADPLAAARAFFAGLTDPGRAAHERLFFELYGAALQGQPYATPMLEGVVTDWLGPATAAFADLTGDDGTAAADGRLALAVVRGLLLDLLTTGDRDSVTAAHERYLALYADRLPPPPSPVTD